jgi:hypothetical protein
MEVSIADMSYDECKNILTCLLSGRNDLED